MIDMFERRIKDLISNFEENSIKAWLCIDDNDHEACAAFIDLCISTIENIRELIKENFNFPVAQHEIFKYLYDREILPYDYDDMVHDLEQIDIKRKYVVSVESQFSCEDYLTMMYELVDNMETLKKLDNYV